MGFRKTWVRAPGAAEILKDVLRYLTGGMEGNETIGAVCGMYDGLKFGIRCIL
jgi:hypothetical protein